MKDPTRWADGGDAPGELGQLLQSARDDIPSREELAGVAAALAPMMPGASGTGSASGGTAGGGAAAASGAVSGPVVVLAVVAACALAGGGLYGLVKSSAPTFTEAPAQLEVPPPAPEVEVRGSAPSQQKKAAAVEAESAEPVVAAPTSPPASAKPGPSEAALLRDAQRVVRSNPKRALELTQEHRRRFPDGALVQEREVIAIEALKALGDQKAASERAGDFEKSFPGSAHLPKVETLKQDPPGTP